MNRRNILKALCLSPLAFLFKKTKNSTPPANGTIIIQGSSPISCSWYNLSPTGEIWDRYKTEYYIDHKCGHSSTTESTTVSVFDLPYCPKCRITV